MAKPSPDPKPWRTADVSLVKGTLRARQAEDDRRAKSWFADREAELEAVVNRSYDGSDVPGIPERVAKAQAMVEPIFEEIRSLFREAYPAEFAQMEIGIAITPGGIDPKFRQQVRRDATVHLQSRYRNKLAAIATHSTETIAEVSARATSNPEVKEVLARLAGANAATPHLAAPGPAIGILKRLLPNPEEWGLDDNAAALLPAPADQKALPAPKRK
jgi:hypothetical protein